ncbi:MAG: ATP-binding protein [Acidobacteria bacterium]|nr:ATP-binding protein [Acidobacteriota bacterium]
MFIDFTEAELNQLIIDGVEEDIHLDYKAAEALAKTDGKRNEIAKDVSAFANSDGGIIIYGISEHNDADKQHLPERINPVDRTQFSKEWLEQVINSKVRPRISELIIKPIDIPAVNNGVVYVVQIPRSHTPHQAGDKRYYKRFNFESVPMDDYEINDIRNRKQHYKPLISIDYEIMANHMVYLLVANVGDTTAYDVSFSS